MATIENQESKERITILVQHILGRHPDSSNTILRNPDVSRMHAVISWDHEHWFIKDTSANGTYVNGTRLPSGSQRLYKGDIIQFGSLHAELWTLVDIKAPQSMLLPINSELKPILLTGIVPIPSEEQPDITLYLSIEGQWMCESPAGTHPLNSGDIVGTNNKNWRFIDCKPSIETQTFEKDNNDAAFIKFDFRVSQNEEHISVLLQFNDTKVDLGERSHHYLILLLARQRIGDRAACIDTAEQGWIVKDHLVKMLGLSEHHINIQIYRFRKQVLNSLPKTMLMHQIIERRSGELRFACDNISIEGGLQTLKNGVGEG